MLFVDALARECLLYLAEEHRKSSLREWPSCWVRETVGRNSRKLPDTYRRSDLSLRRSLRFPLRPTTRKAAI